MRNLTWLVFTGIVVIPLGCHSSAVPAPDSARVTKVATNSQGRWSAERIYQNEYFGIQLTIPEDWHFEKGMNQAAEEMGTDLLVGEDQNKRKMMDAALKNTHTSFMAYRYPPGTPGKSNPNVICMIEKVTHLPGVKTGGDYLLLMEDTLKNSNVEISYLNAPHEVSLQEIPFFVRSSTLKLGFAEVSQTTYARKIGDHVLLITASTMEESDETVVAELIDGIGPLTVPTRETP